MMHLLRSLLKPKERQRLWREHRSRILRAGGVGLVFLVLLLAASLYFFPPAPLGTSFGAPAKEHHEAARTRRIQLLRQVPADKVAAPVDDGANLVAEQREREAIPKWKALPPPPPPADVVAQRERDLDARAEAALNSASKEAQQEMDRVRTDSSEVISVAGAEKSFDLVPLPLPAEEELPPAFSSEPLPPIEDAFAQVPVPALVAEAPAAPAPAPVAEEPVPAAAEPLVPDAGDHEFSAPVPAVIPDAAVPDAAAGAVPAAVDSSDEPAAAAPVTQLRPSDEIVGHVPPESVNRLGAAARSRISRISRVVDQADLNRMKLGADGGAAPAPAFAPSPSAEAPSSSDEDAFPPAVDEEPSVDPVTDTAVGEDDFDSLEQHALDRWQGTNYTSRAARYSTGWIDSEGAFVPGPFALPGSPTEGWDREAMKDLTLVYDFGAGGCSGWGLEATHMVLSLEPFLGRVGVIAGPNSWCAGLSEEKIKRLDMLRSQPVASWKNIDIWVSHKPPSRYPSFPYRGAVTVEQAPLFVVGRSMTEVHRISPDWARRVEQMVDEVWLPARHSRDSFVRGGVPMSKLILIPEPVDPELYDPLSIVSSSSSSLAFPGLKGRLRSFNFLSIFKFEERKNWRGLLRAWMFEFSENEDVTLTLHTYLFGSDAWAGDARSAKRILQLITDFVDSLDFAGRDLVARPLPFANLIIHTEEIATNQMPAFYAEFDAFVLPSHGEGWGMPLAEAMSMGLPSISTNWGGQTEFMSGRNSYLLPVESFSQADTTFFDAGAKWANPSEKVLRAVMRHMVQHPEHVLPIGARGRASVVQNFNRYAVALRMLQRLQKIYPVILDRRLQKLEGRKIVRGAHLQTSIGVGAVTPPSAVQANEGMLARRGSVQAAEAAKVAEAKEAQEIAAALAESKRTAWEPAKAEAEVAAAEAAAVAVDNVAPDAVAPDAASPDAAPAAAAGADQPLSLAGGINTADEPDAPPPFAQDLPLPLPIDEADPPPPERGGFVGGWKKAKAAAKATRASVAREASAAAQADENFVAEVVSPLAAPGGGEHVFPVPAVASIAPDLKELGASISAKLEPLEASIAAKLDPLRASIAAKVDPLAESIRTKAEPLVSAIGDKISPALKASMAQDLNPLGASIGPDLDPLDATIRAPPNPEVLEGSIVEDTQPLKASIAAKLDPLAASIRAKTEELNAAIRAAKPGVLQASIAEDQQPLDASIASPPSPPSLDEPAEPQQRPPPLPLSASIGDAGRPEPLSGGIAAPPGPVSLAASIVVAEAEEASQSQLPNAENVHVAGDILPDIPRLIARTPREPVAAASDRVDAGGDGAAEVPATESVPAFAEPRTRRGDADTHAERSPRRRGARRHGTPKADSGESNDFARDRASSEFARLAAESAQRQESEPVPPPQPRPSSFDSRAGSKHGRGSPRIASDRVGSHRRRPSVPLPNPSPPHEFAPQTTPRHLRDMESSALEVDSTHADTVVKPERPAALRPRSERAASSDRSAADATPASAATFSRKRSHGRRSGSHAPTAAADTSVAGLDSFVSARPNAEARQPTRDSFTRKTRTGAAAQRRSTPRTRAPATRRHVQPVRLL